MDIIEIYKMDKKALVEYIWSNKGSKKYILIDLFGMNDGQLLDIALDINNK